MEIDHVIAAYRAVGNVVDFAMGDAMDGQDVGAAGHAHRWERSLSDREFAEVGEGAGGTARGSEKR